MKKFEIEKEGQINFFEQFGIDYVNNNILVEYTDGVYNSNILEFKLNIKDLNRVLFQAIKYLSNMRVKGESVPKNILCIDLNSRICYKFDSKDYFEEIHQIYFGGASKNNEGFVIKKDPDKISYMEMNGTLKIKEVLNDIDYLKIELDENCIVGWAERYYRENPRANKGDFLDDRKGTIVSKTSEIREPKVFKDYIIPYKGKTNERFKYLMDKLNDRLNKKVLGAYYTPIEYCLKSLELVREAIANIPEGNDYIILDRCAGTGNLESLLTDEELSHCVLSTIEYYEYKVLLERLGNKVRAIIPPIESLVEYHNGFILNADAMTEEYINNEIITQFIKNPKCSIILFENPPYDDSSSIRAVYDEEGNKHITKNKESFIFNEMKNVKEMFKNNNISTVRDFANRFIWSAFKYYLRQTGDAYIVYSPVKYFKSLGIVHNDNKRYKKGFIFNRKHFHASASVISCVYWTYEETEKFNGYIMPAYDLNFQRELEYIKDIEILQTFKSFNEYQDKIYGKNIVNISCNSSGEEAVGKKIETKSYDDHNIIGYFCLVSASFTLGRLAYFNGRGFYLTTENYLSKLPLFCAKVYPEDKWYEKDIYFKTSDKGNEYLDDKELIKSSLIFTCLSEENHIRSFVASNNKLYQNELCFNEQTVALKKLKQYSLTEKEEILLNLNYKIFELAKQTKNYDNKLYYGIFQISKELNTFTKDEDLGKDIPDYPELNGQLNSLKSRLKEYYIDEIKDKLFKYQLLK